VSYFKPISISLSPNVERDDLKIALNLIIRPWLWRKGKATGELEGQFRQYLGVKYAVSFNSGRSALMAILEALEIKKGEEILLQAFTCNSAVNPILKKGATPIFVDIDNTLNLAPLDLMKKISPRAKAVMVQHNFGMPAQMDEILKICREKNLILIEDCAHALGAKFKGKFCGTFGKAAFFSFGRDKIISSIFGGMAATDDVEIGKRLKNFQEKLDFPSNLWIVQQLLHPILVNYLVLPAYGLNQYLGRILIGFFHKVLLLSKAVYGKEKMGEIPGHFPKRLPGALSILALNQFKKLARFNEHRRTIASLYEKELKKFNLPLSQFPSDKEPVFMRYPVLIERKTDEILKEARQKGFFLDDGWRKSVVVPPDTSIKKMNYLPGTCPRAEKVAQTILNLPTHINISRLEARKIVEFLRKFNNLS